LPEFGFYYYNVSKTILRIFPSSPACQKSKLRDKKQKKKKKTQVSEIVLHDRYLLAVLSIILDLLAFNCWGRRCIVAAVATSSYQRRCNGVVVVFPATASV
jgi:hypothetical protein